MTVATFFIRSCGYAATIASIARGLIETEWYSILRYGIFGDIHGNYDALETVLKVLEQEKVDIYLCTGDVVGYGAEPSRCITAVREKCVVCLAGNHDHAACGKLDTEFFNIFAKQVAHWTQTHLSEEERAWLAGLPFICHFEDFTLAHGSAHSPEVFNYITTIFDAELSFECLDKPLLFYGHTHIPLAFFDTVPIRDTDRTRLTSKVQSITDFRESKFAQSSAHNVIL